jgi:hypothetical protein
MLLEMAHQGSNSGVADRFIDILQRFFNETIVSQVGSRATLT